MPSVIADGSPGNEQRVAGQTLSGKSQTALLDEAVEQGASIEQIQGAQKNAPAADRIEVTEAERSQEHVPYGTEFDEAEATLADETVADSTGPVTAAGKEREILSRLIPDREAGTHDVTQADPRFLTSVGWAIQDYGITTNVGRWTQQALQEVDPDGTKQILSAMPELMFGVSEEYSDYIAGQPNFEAAEREADHLRVQAYRDKLRENEGIGQALTAGVAGFILDPINLVPGALMVPIMQKSP